jgi:hypothetical protein
MVSTKQTQNSNPRLFIEVKGLCNNKGYSKIRTRGQHGLQSSSSGMKYLVY